MNHLFGVLQMLIVLQHLNLQCQWQLSQLFQSHLGIHVKYDTVCLSHSYFSFTCMYRLTQVFLNVNSLTLETLPLKSVVALSYFLYKTKLLNRFHWELVSTLWIHINRNTQSPCSPPLILVDVIQSFTKIIVDASLRRSKAVVNNLSA